MNYKKYNRCIEAGFFRGLRYWLLDTFGRDKYRRCYKSDRKTVSKPTVMYMVATKKGYCKDCFGSPRFKGYRE